MTPGDQLVQEAIRQLHDLGSIIPEILAQWLRWNFIIHASFLIFFVVCFSLCLWAVVKVGRVFEEEKVEERRLAMMLPFLVSLLFLIGIVSNTCSMMMIKYSPKVYIFEHIKELIR